MSYRKNRKGTSVYRVKNWPQYNKVLKNRGKIVFMITENLEKSWYVPSFEKQVGGQFEYSDFAIETCLSIKKLLRLGLRQTQGFMEGLFIQTGINLKVPDYSILSRRAKELNVKIKRYKDKDRESVPKDITVKVDSTGLKFYGEGEWMNEKHGSKVRKAWRKAHIIIDESGTVVSADLTDNTVSDASAVHGMLSKVDENIDTFMADGVYDQEPLHDYLETKYPGINIITPPRKDAVLSPDAANNPTRRDKYIMKIKDDGRDLWALKSGYSKRNSVENTMYRYKTIFGGKLDLKNIQSQKTEFMISCNNLNIMTSLGMPESYKITQ